MSFERFGDAPLRPRRTSLVAIIALVLAVGSIFLPAIAAVIVAGGAIVLALIARRQLKRDPATGPSWVSLTALVLGGFVFVSQGVLLALFAFSG